MSMIVRAFPVRGSVKDVEAFAAELNGARKAEAAAFYRKFGLAHESWHVQVTPAGPWVIAVSVVDNPSEVAPQLAASNAEFDAWFKKQVLLVTGIDQSQQPLGPPTTQVYAWSDEQRPSVNLSA